LNILFWACSSGCEPYTLKFLIGSEADDKITGIDQDVTAIKKARAAVYRAGSFEGFFGEKKRLLSEEEIAQLFESAPDNGSTALRVSAPYRKNTTFLTGNLFSAKPSVPTGSFDLVICNNLLLHLKPYSAEAAWDYLYRYLRDDGVLVVGGCNPEVRSKAAKRLGLRPRAEKLSEINRSWTGISGAWHFKPRPAWAYPDPDEKDPDYAFLAGEIFEKCGRP
jgi:chemotaxis methyl-accepting protein methylase